MREEREKRQTNRREREREGEEKERERGRRGRGGEGEGEEEIVRRTGVQGHFWLHSRFKNSLGYSKPCLKNKLKDFKIVCSKILES